MDFVILKVKSGHNIVHVEVLLLLDLVGGLVFLLLSSVDSRGLLASLVETKSQYHQTNEYYTQYNSNDGYLGGV